MSSPRPARAGAPVRTPETRAALAAEPADRATHAGLLERLGGLDDLEVAPPPRGRDPAPRSLRVVCWNAERGRHLDAAAALLGREQADVYLLSELDHGMARTGNLHTARELAGRLGCGFAYGVEFLELGLGDADERRTHAGEANAVGHHGGAVLSPHALADPLLVRLERSGRWFDGTLGERRIGGRMAVLARVTAGDRAITVASVHLESHGDPAGRCTELEVLLDAVERHAAGGPALIAGDLNTSSLTRADVEDRSRLAARLEEDPERLANPVPHEPLFARAEARGWSWRDCNDLATSTHRRRSPPGRGALRLDWFLARGLHTHDARVIAAVDAQGEALSDHEAIALTVEPAD